MVYIGCASCQFHFNINKLFFNLQSLTDYLWIYILDHDFINKITTPYSSPLPKEKFWIRAYDVEPIINWRRVSLSFQRRCFSISETYGKARLKPICLQKNALFHAKPWSLKKKCFRRMVRYFSAMLAT